MVEGLLWIPKAWSSVSNHRKQKHLVFCLFVLFVSLNFSPFFCFHLSFYFLFAWDKDLLCSTGRSWTWHLPCLGLPSARTVGVHHNDNIAPFKKWMFCRLYIIGSCNLSLGIGFVIVCLETGSYISRLASNSSLVCENGLQLLTLLPLLHACWRYSHRPHLVLCGAVAGSRAGGLQLLKGEQNRGCCIRQEEVEMLLGNREGKCLQ